MLADRQITQLRQRRDRVQDRRRNPIVRKYVQQLQRAKACEGREFVERIVRANVQLCRVRRDPLELACTIDAEVLGPFRRLSRAIIIEHTLVEED